MAGYFSNIFYGIKSLSSGLGVTLKHCFRKPITMLYPEEKPVIQRRFRGRLVMPVDPATGTNRCTACMLCVKACPNYSIEVKKETGEDGKPKPRAAAYTYRSGTCMYCNLCVEACPFAAILMSEEYETATRDRESLNIDLAAENHQLKGSKLSWWLAKFKGEEPA